MFIILLGNKLQRPYRQYDSKEEAVTRARTATLTDGLPRQVAQITNNVSIATVVVEVPCES